MPRALLSVSDKAGILEFARGLRARRYEIVSTGGTARVLEAGGVPVTAISDVTGWPEMLDGRVKTLHPAVHGAILARRSRPADLQTLADHGISLIDIVTVNLYPFAKIAGRSDATLDALIEEIDIGGPALLRAAAKNFRDVLVVVDPADYEGVLRALDQPGAIGPAHRLTLARKAFAHTAAYDETIATALGRVRPREDGFEWPGPSQPGLPERLKLDVPRRAELRYGENPHQAAGWYGDSAAAAFGSAAILQGKELSFTNLLDLDAAARVVLEFDEPAAVIIKHTNPCGVAVGVSAAEAYMKARDADPVSAFGGIVGLNRPVDAPAAQAITSTFIEAIVAPRVEPSARTVLSSKTALRVLEGDFSRAGIEDQDLRSILGGFLVQSRDRVLEARSRWEAASAALRVMTRRAPTAEEWEALRFAWRVSAHVKSNAVVFTGLDRTLAIGAGQTSRVEAVKVAVMKAPDGGLTGSVAASDAFFPFRDGLDAIAAAGATAVVQPGGSRRDEDVIAAADEHGLAMVFTGRRHFRH